jgi:hypothetical protein
MMSSMSATEYELFVRDYIQGLQDQFVADLQSIVVEHDQTKMGRSGATHQFDVYLEIRNPINVIRIAIECKNYTTADVEIGRVRDFFGALTDVGASGVMVTTNKYQAGAIKFAEHYGINLIVLPTLGVRS